jgi:hypothetical protein
MNVFEKAHAGIVIAAPEILKITDQPCSSAPIRG